MADRDPQVAGALALLQRKFAQYRTDHAISDDSHLARSLDISRGTLRPILKDGRLPSGETLKTLRKRISFTDGEVQQLETAFSRVISLARSKGAKTARGGTHSGGTPPLSADGRPQDLSARAEDDEQIAEAHALFKRKIEGFQKQRNLSLNAAARTLEVPRTTLQSIMKGALPSSETVAKMKVHLSLSNDDVQKIEIACSRHLTLTRSKGRRNALVSREGSASENSYASPGEYDQSDLLARVERLEQAVFRQSRERTTGAPPLSSTPPSFEDLLRGEGMDRYAVGDLPHILTADNFRPMDAKEWSPDQRTQCAEYIAFLVDTLRKYLNIVAQLEPEDFRRTLLASLHKRFNELWRSFKIATSVNPPKCVELMTMEDSMVIGGSKR